MTDSTSKNDKDTTSLLQGNESSRGSLKSLYQFCTTRDYLLLAAASVFTAVYSILPVVVVIEIGQVIDAMDDQDSDEDTFYEEERDIAIVQIILGVITILFSWAAVTLFIKLGNKVGIQWKSEYYRAIVRRPISWFDEHNPAELGSSIDMDCDCIEHAAGEKIMLVGSAVIFFIGCWVLSFIVNLQMTLIALIMLPIQLGAALTIERVSFKSSQESQNKYQVAGGIAEESLEGVKTVASCNAQSRMAQRYQAELAPLKRSTTLMGFLHGLGWAVFFVVLFSFSGVLFYFGANLLDDEEENWLNDELIESQDIVMVFFATAMSAFHLGTVAPCFQYIQKGKVAAAHVEQLIREADKFDGMQAARELQGKVEFKSVQFSYPSSPLTPVLQGVDFEIQPGQSLAVVGETGSGKSTVIQLIQGFYYPDGGSVLIDGVDIRDYDLISLRQHIGLVSQEPILFSTTIKENIKLGKLNASEDEIRAAAQEAEAEFIDKLESGYDTFVGTKGSQLSGGQKQRVAIARVLIKKPRILLLDEATSALDVETEAKIQHTLERVAANTTTVIVAQRLSTVKHADCIVVLDEGIVAESGSHDELCAKEGIYYRLLAVQDKADVVSGEFSHEAAHEKDASSDSQEESEQAAEKGKEFSRIIRMTRAYWPWLLLAAVSAMTSGALFPIFGYLFSDNLTTLLSDRGDSMLDTVKENMFYLFIEASIVLFSVTLLCLGLARITASFTYDLRYDGMNALLFYDQQFFDMPENNPGSLAYRLGSDTEHISNIGGPILGIQCMVIVSIVTGIVVAMHYDAVVAAVILCVIPLMIVSSARGALLQVQGLANADLKETTAIASDSLTNVRTVQAFNRQEYFHQKYIAASETESQRALKSAHFNGVMFGSRYFSMYLLWATVAWFGAYRVLEDKTEIDTVLIVFFVIFFSTWGFLMVGALAPDVKTGIDSAQRLFTMIDYTPQINAQDNSGDTSPIDGHVQFTNVHFKYPNRGNHVLNSISFNCPAGFRLGITGTTGSGKSTIAQLLLRFYDVTGGSISIDQKDIRAYNIAHLRNSIGWVGQEPVLFRGSLMHNMYLAKADVTEADAIEALLAAQANEVLERYGLHSNVGLRGSRLSGGQKQRVAIARALLRNPQVLVLDEATSALDTKTEQNLQERLKEYRCTIISIAHRLKSIQQCNKILLLQFGHIVEEGSHEELMKIPDGAYQKLYNSSV